MTCFPFFALIVEQFRTPPLPKLFIYFSTKIGEREKCTTQRRLEILKYFDELNQMPVERFLCVNKNKIILLISFRYGNEPTLSWLCPLSNSMRNIQISPKSFIYRQFTNMFKEVMSARNFIVSELLLKKKTLYRANYVVCYEMRVKKKR